MSTYHIVSFVILGIYIGFAVGQLFIYLINKQRTTHLYMTFLGFSSALLLGVSIATHSVHEFDKAAKLVPYQVGSYLVAVGSLIAVIHHLNDKKRRRLFSILLAFLCALLVANFIFPYSIVFESIDTIDHISVLGFDSYSLPKGTTHSFNLPLAVLLYVSIIIFITLNMYDRYKTGYRTRTYIFGGILLFYVFGNFYDSLVDERVISGLLLTEYMMLPIILSIYADNYLELESGRFYTIKYEEIQRNFLKLIENVELFVVGIDLNGDITYVNKFFEQKMSVDSGSIVGISFYKKFLPVSDHSEYEEVLKFLKHDREIKKVEFQLTSPSNGNYHVSWSIVPIKDNNGQITEILGVGTDVTEQVSVNERLKNSNQKLQKLTNRLEEENTMLKLNLKGVNLQGFNIIGKSDTMKYVFHSINEVAKTDSTVLIEGETGVGKELVARAIHDKSNRFDMPFIKVNCGALPKDLIESEFFGHVKGAFTGALNARKGRFELADGGTIFLDEIGELPLDLQSKLLRVLENSEFNPVGSEKLKRVDVRVVAATNRNLKEFSSEGRFRSDLYYRLSVFPITVPPLRNRVDDIPLLVEHFLIGYCKKLNIDVLPVNVSTMKKLQAYSWPGNVRELKNVIERSVISSMSRGKLVVDKSSLKENLSPEKMRKSLIEVEREYIVSILNETGWKISGKDSTSFILNINEATLRSKMKRLGISKSEVKI